MNREIKLNLANWRLGRIVLHLACIVRGGKFAWHFRRIASEVFTE